MEATSWRSPRAARYSVRTLEAYRQDLRGFFQWAADHDVLVLVATHHAFAAALESMMV